MKAIYKTQNSNKYNGSSTQICKEKGKGEMGEGKGDNIEKYKENNIYTEIHKHCLCAKSVREAVTERYCRE